MKHFDACFAHGADFFPQDRLHITGTKPGPTLVIIGKGPAFHSAIDRLKSLASLAYLRGELWVCPDLPEVSIDTLIHIKTDVEAEAYWHILGAAARLGMISGRGIPTRHLKAARC